MDYRQALEKLERLRELVKKVHTGADSSLETRDEITLLYGACEPLINQIIGVGKVDVPGHHGIVESYPNMIAAGYLSSRTMHRAAGYQELLRVVGRVRQLVESPGVPQDPSSITQLVRVLRRFRPCCQYSKPLENEKAVQDVLWVILRAQFDRLEREVPLPRFGTKAHRPDFRVPDLLTLVEVKYIGTSTSPQSIQEEIQSDVHGYLNESSGCTGLVVFVYDAANKLCDATSFVESLRSISGIVEVIVEPGLGRA